MIDAFLHFADRIIEVATIYSDKYGKRKVLEWNRKHPNNKKDWKPITRLEMDAAWFVVVNDGWKTDIQSRYAS